MRVLRRMHAELPFAFIANHAVLLIDIEWVSADHMAPTKERAPDRSHKDGSHRRFWRCAAAHLLLDQKGASPRLGMVAHRMHTRRSVG